MYDTVITFRTSKAVKREAQELFDNLGMDLSTALNIFLRKSVREQAVPFKVSLNEEFNEETKAVIREAIEHPETLEGPYETVEETLEALHS